MLRILLARALRIQLACQHKILEEKGAEPLAAFKFSSPFCSESKQQLCSELCLGHCKLLARISNSESMLGTEAEATLEFGFCHAAQQPKNSAERYSLVCAALRFCLARKADFGFCLCSKSKRKF